MHLGIGKLLFYLLILIVFPPLGIYLLYKRQTYKEKPIFIYTNDYVKSNSEPSYQWDYIKEEWVKN